jgi:hypothetical protein
MMDYLEPGDQRRLRARMADLDFAQRKTRREQNAVACKHLRAFEEEKRFTDDATAWLMGLKHEATIESQFCKHVYSTGQPSRSALLSEDAKSWMIEFG